MIICPQVEDPIKRDEGAPGPWNISRVEWNPSGLQGRLVAVASDASHPLGRTGLYQGDAYVIQYAVRKGRSPDVIYFWQGADSSNFEKGASAILTVQLDEVTGGRARHARVEEGKEPEHFLAMMGGTFTTLQGGVQRKKATQQDTDGLMLFRIQSECNSVGSRKPVVRTRQVDEKRSSLTDQDAFLLVDSRSKEVITWSSPAASPEETATAAKVAESVLQSLLQGDRLRPEVFTGTQPPQEITGKLKD